MVTKLVVVAREALKLVMVPDADVRSVIVALEMVVVASVEVPVTTRAPFEVREDVAINEPTSAAPCKVVDASEDDVVEVSAPTVSEPTVAIARVAVFVATNDPEVTDPIVALLAVRD